ncbi:cell division control protein 48 homolog B-like [Lolium rigidum]|uniref:cell division control protein 48 homolog B-like n=1 Tax=Lolium rigidum TaxID=89674 RepID=UPI001F5D985B|nr:cell division control protein 48 homolog B-like [Lolium rigidum]
MTEETAASTSTMQPQQEKLVRQRWLTSHESTHNTSVSRRAKQHSNSNGYCGGCRSVRRQSSQGSAAPPTRHRPAPRRTTQPNSRGSRTTSRENRIGEVMAAGSRGVDGGSNGDGGEPDGGWRAEDAIAGNRMALQALRELVVYPFLYARESRLLGLKWPRGLLLYGPPGTGKTSLVQAIVRECNAHLTMIEPYSVHKPHAGEGERFLREAFAEAYSQASQGRPAIIFIDELDAICPRRDSKREQGSRIVGQLLTLMDGNKKSSKKLPHVVVVASTNRVDAIDPALRRPGRFDSEIEVSVPTVEERVQILELHTKDLHLHETVDLQTIAGYCNGYVGADLQALCREAARFAYRRLSNSSEDEEMITLLMEDWESARYEAKASMIRGVTKEAPTVSWDDIGGLKDLKKKLQQAVEWPIKHAAAFARLGISPVRGVLLHGPPGCSKTTLAKAAAHAAQASFFSLSGAELYSKYVGEGEALLRRTFQRARLSAPSIIFFDEADAIAPKRTGPDGGSGNATVGERLLSTLLTEMDGLELATGIIVLAATNRPKAIDAALLRPGRFDMVLYVPPPDAQGRHEILRIKTRKMGLGEDVDLGKIAERTELFTGADLEGLCREAGMLALREDITASSIDKAHFEAAVRSLKPSLTKAEVDEYAAAAIHGPSTRKH